VVKQQLAVEMAEVVKKIEREALNQTQDRAMK
jgi:hypothetical protein